MKQFFKQLISKSSVQPGMRLIFLLLLMMPFAGNAQTAYFTPYPRVGCAPLLVDFYNASLPGAYLWNFGDPYSGILNTSNKCSPYHLYDSPGVYIVTLQVTISGITYTTTDTVWVNPRPNPKITGDSGVCINSTGTYSIVRNPGSTYSWSVSGGSFTTNSTHDSITVTWGASGPGSVSVTETNSYGCSTTNTKRVFVSPLPHPILGCGDFTNASHGNEKDTGCVCAFSYQTVTMPNNGDTYQWIVTNGTIVSGDSGDTVVIHWGGSGFATIKVIETNSYGCKDSSECVRPICDKPFATFTANNACVGQPVYLNSTGSLGHNVIKTHSWSHGTTVFSTDSSTTTTFSTAGTDTISLTITNENGCTDDTSEVVTIKTGTSPSIYCVSTVCAGTSAWYYSQYIAGAIYMWSATGGTVIGTSGDSVHITWGAGPVGTVKVKVIGGGYTCSDSDMVTVPVFPANPEISGNTIVCPFSQESYCAPSIPGSVYKWKVLGGFLGPQTGNCVTIYWPGAGTGAVILHMYNELTCCSGDDTIFVTVKPKFVITGPDSACLHAKGTYTLSGGLTGTWSVSGGSFTTPSVGVGSVTIRWDGPSPGFISATPPLPLTSGIYCNSVAVMHVLINDPPAPASISGPSVVCQGSKDEYYVSPVPFNYYSWSVSPSNSILGSSVLDSVKVKWTTSGMDTLFLLDSNYHGCKTLNKYDVQVVPSVFPGIVGASVACVNDIRIYTIPGGNPNGIYVWQVIGGNILSGLGTGSLKVQWGYISQGTIIVHNPACGTSYSLTVTLYPTPVVSIDSSVNCAGTSVILTAEPGGYASYQWSGGSSVTTQSALCTLATTYTVQVTNAGGCTNTATINLSSGLPHYPHPTSTITITPVIPSPTPLWQFCAPYDPNYRYRWSNGDTTECIFVSDTLSYADTVYNQYGCKSIDPAHVGGGHGGHGHPGCYHSYSCSNPGSPVILTAPGPWPYSWSTGAITASISVTAVGTYTVIYNGGLDTCTYDVDFKPKDSFSVPASLCNPVQFTNYSTGATGGYRWDFGDGTYSNAVNPSHSYADTGYYYVVLWAVNTHGCWVSYTIRIHVRSVLHASFTINPHCHDSVTFVNTSFHHTYGIVSYNWNFGDGGTSTAINPIHVYVGAIKRLVRLVISDGICADTFYDSVQPPFIRAIGAICSAGCTGETLEFMDHSLSSVPIVSWLWRFGDGTTSTLENPWHVYSTASTYTVKLIITNSSGCKDSFTLPPVTVSTYAAGPITASGSLTFCEGDSVVLTAPASSGYMWSDGEITQSITVKKSGVFTVVVLSSTGCKDTLGPKTVIVNPRPNAKIHPGGPITTCQNNPVILSTEAGATYTYKWYLNGVLIPGAGASTYSVSQLWQAGSYTVSIRNTYGCYDSSGPVAVTVDSAPLAYVATAPFCSGGFGVLTVVHYGGPAIVSYHWSTGATTPSITVYDNKTYTCVVTGANGCSTTITGYPQENPMPDLSQIPKGCYTICAGSIDSVCGPAPSYPNQYEYKWFNGATLVCTTECIPISSAGSYWLVVKDSSTHCADTSAAFSVTVVPGPVATITSSGGTVLCAGSSATITLTADSGSTAGYSYLWSTGATTQSIVISTAGTYWVKVMVNKCCFAIDSITITEVANCCFPPGKIYITIPDGYTISANTVWVGKYYIAGKVYVTNNAILDLTEVDLVFDSLGEIIFQNQSIIRANNSVFRPCRMNGTWIGMTFKDSSWGYIHTSLYKNATIAVNVLTDDSFSVRLTDNSFVNCNTGVYVNKNNHYTQGITGNSFTMDNTTLHFPSPKSYFGIVGVNTDFDELISQNQFRNSARINQGNMYYGIQMLKSSCDISQNTFSDMYRSVDVNSPDKMLAIENNTMEITQSTVPYDYQIRVDKNSAPLLIFNNNIINSMNEFNNTSAIYCSNSSALNIKGNNITGFGYGIQLFQDVSSEVVENNIENTNVIGIYYFDGVNTTSNNMDIACNKIKMDLINNYPVYPIGIMVDEADKSTRIRTNCIFNATIALYLNCPLTAPTYNMPLVKNNYFYNYTSYGIYNTYYSGNIGTSGTVFNNAGRNTFVSNNFAGGAIDIYSQYATITQGGNYGVLAVNINVTSVAGSYFNSTADCGLQINTVDPYAERTDGQSICDQYYGQIIIIGTGDGTGTVGSGTIGSGTVGSGTIGSVGAGNTAYGTGLFVLSADFRKLFDSLNATQMYQVASTAVNALSWGPDYSQMDILYNYVSSTHKLNPVETEWFNYDYALAKKNYAMAGQILSNITPSSSDESDRVRLELLKVNMLKSNRRLNSLTGSEKAFLSDMDSRRLSPASEARDMLQLTGGNHEFIFQQPKLPKIAANDSVKVYRFDEETIQVYPNPAHDKLNLYYYSTQQGLDHENIEIHDALGRLVGSRPVVFNGSLITIDISNLSSGVYILSITNNGKAEKLKIRFVKS